MTHTLIVLAVVLAVTTVLRNWQHRFFGQLVQRARLAALRCAALRCTALRWAASWALLRSALPARKYRAPALGHRIWTAAAPRCQTDAC